MNTPNTVEKGISEIVGVFSDPILVFPGGWGDALPEWLKNAITLERLEMNMRALKGEEMTEKFNQLSSPIYPEDKRSDIISRIRSIEVEKTSPI